MKKRNLSNLKLKKQTVSNLDSRIHGGLASLPTLGIICTIYSYLQCTDITHTSKDYNGRHCDIATINDSCLSVCDDKCNDF
jgi:hypothetical protein